MKGMETPTSRISKSTDGEPPRHYFKDLYLSSYLSDARLTFPKEQDLNGAGGNSLPVHKFILTSKSDVFQIMFDETLKVDRDTIQITDTDMDTMKEVLR